MYLSGQALADIRRELVISHDQWLRWWSGFRAVLAEPQQDCRVLAEDLDLAEC